MHASKPSPAPTVRDRVRIGTIVHSVHMANVIEASGPSRPIFADRQRESVHAAHATSTYRPPSIGLSEGR